MMILRNYVNRVVRFEKEAHRILAVHESSSSRVVLLENTYNRIGSLSLKQDELFRQSLKCIEHELFRASHVMAWAGFMDFLEEKLYSDKFKKLKKERLKWKSKTIEDLREEVNEYQLIEVLRDLNLCTKNEVKALKGLLNKRNECAHPSDFDPGLNESLGYVSELLKRITKIQPKYL